MKLIYEKNGVKNGEKNGEKNFRQKFSRKIKNGGTLLIEILR